MNIGIVGHEGAKFTFLGEAEARRIIWSILMKDINNNTLISGGCHLGGIDIWAEEIADDLGIGKWIYYPKELNWSNGYKPRNELIAKKSDIVYCLVVKRFADSYAGMKFNYCYHCETSTHIKSGGCWTAKFAEILGKETKIIELENNE